jgi:adenine-specific DNA-methyltransferase
MSLNKKAILARLDELSPQELKRYLVQELTQKRLGLTWEADLIERDKALNSDLVFPRVDPELSHWPEQSASNNLIIEGDNFDSLRLLRSTHRGRIRVIYIDPPYNTGSKDWVYNDHYLKKDDRWKHSKWLEFMYQRLSIARDLLTPDGVIMVSINDENRSKLELLMDEVMPGMRIGSFVWKTRTGGNDTRGAFLSDNHEHILIYGNPVFQFKGLEKSYSIYTHEENGRPFYLSDLAKAHNWRERPNTFYPLKDPATGIVYPCNPNRVWAYASKERSSDLKLRTKTMDDMIESGDVWFPQDQRVEEFSTLEELLRAIASKDVPMSGKTPLLWADMPNLNAWVGVKIGYGRPRLKKFQDQLKNTRTPVSSWLTPRTEKTSVSSEDEYLVGGTTEGTAEVRNVMQGSMGGASFPYPKPPSVLAAILDQATQGNDIILDFFAGSGTTAQAVIGLNAKDGGNRRFIMCSSTEATAKEPDKNLCRDVCAERVRRVMSGYGDTPGLGGDFTYFTLDKVEEADLMFEAEPRHAFGLLSLRETGYLSEPPADQPVWVVAQTASSAIVLCPRLSDEAVAALEALPVSQLIVYTDRPDSLQEALAGDKSVTCYSIESALRYAQGGNQASASTAPVGDPEPEQEVSQ